MIELIPIGLSIISFCVRGVVFLTHLASSAIDPLPLDQGPQIPYVQTVADDSVLADRIRLATVIIENEDGRTGSGVCIHPNGYVLTAEHVIIQGKCKVIFIKEGSVDGVVIHSAIDGKDGAALIHCSGMTNAHFLPVAKTSPTPATLLTGVGYHKGNYVSLSGSGAQPDTNVLGLKDAKGRSFLQLPFSAMVGMSGGPVCNDQGEVVSLITNSDTRISYGLPTENLQESASVIPATDAIIQANTRPIMEFWFARGCPPCERFKQDFAPNTANWAKLIALYDVVPCDGETYSAKAAQRSITRFPSFYIPSTKTIYVGYEGDPQAFLAQIAPAGIAYQPPDVQESQSSSPENPPEKVVESKGLMGTLRDKLGDFFGGIIGALLVIVFNAYNKWRAYVAEQNLIKRIALNKAEGKVRGLVHDKIDDIPLLQQILTKGRQYIEP